MFVITFKTKGNIVDEQIELLQINDIFNVYYEAPLEITTDDYGYGYEEKKDELLNLNIAFDGEESELNNFIKNVCSILQNENYTLNKLNYEYEETILPAVEIDENWTLAHPSIETDKNKNKINFISQGAFGTGLHETTKDLLKLILNIDFNNKTIMDIGTGSGILSIAASLKGAKKVTAIDIRDVKEEIELNASLNELSNIEIKVGNALENEFTVDNLYDWIYINIGGEETKLFMDYINEHLSFDGKLLVSGLVEWSFDEVKSFVELKGFKMIEKLQTNEWCTAIFSRK